MAHTWRVALQHLLQRRKTSKTAASFHVLAAPARDEFTEGIDQAGVHSASTGKVLYGKLISPLALSPLVDLALSIVMGCADGLTSCPWDYAESFYRVQELREMAGSTRLHGSNGKDSEI